ncbi:hypothetical protein SKAU_G00314960 [Synaphobranchus kaupii]|uniref:Uncharacterized protein n=1 Tax=Synaphobranchus kaupii TaxID=118154 RepID=A0A9Q1ESI9_SYNKA|nr:hypothetical protein SKAU_G00314960 [Synaphobranchus kaupii]
MRLYMCRGFRLMRWDLLQSRRVKVRGRCTKSPLYYRADDRPVTLEGWCNDEESPQVPHTPPVVKSRVFHVTWGSTLLLCAIVTGYSTSSSATTAKVANASSAEAAVVQYFLSRLINDQADPSAKLALPPLPWHAPKPLQLKLGSAPDVPATHSPSPLLPSNTPPPHAAPFPVSQRDSRILAPSLSI